MLTNIEEQKKLFKDHVAKLSDYENIKVLDFQNPGREEYRIRFIFEEDFCRCHISGDLGELTATNYKNMRYENFSDFVHNTGYFREKIDCHSRPIDSYDYEAAKSEIMELLERHDLLDEAAERHDWEEREEAIADTIDDILEDFTEDSGIGAKGYEILIELYPDAFEVADNIGKESTNILELYMLAFELATKQLKENDSSDNTKKEKETNNPLRS